MAAVELDGDIDTGLYPDGTATLGGLLIALDGDVAFDALVDQRELTDLASWTADASRKTRIDLAATGFLSISVAVVAPPANIDVRRVRRHAVVMPPIVLDPNTHRPI